MGKQFRYNSEDNSGSRANWGGRGEGRQIYHFNEVPKCLALLIGDTGICKEIL